MAVYFFVSSSLVKRYVFEVGTPWKRGVTDPVNGHSLYIAQLTGVEAVSAVTRRLRRGEMSSLDAAMAVADFRFHYTNVYFLMRADPGNIAHAMDLVEKHGLRAYGAVQLATALQLLAKCRAEGTPDPVFISADANLNAAAEGLTVDNPNAHP